MGGGRREMGRGGRRKEK
uniref:Uncharacterized protein n=1 Tax=Arundo donax TaxID=35708 RepID=A0A0A8ZXV5_ARUDO